MHQIEFNLQSIRADPIAALESQLSSLPAGAVSERGELQTLLAREQQKRKQWAFENALRRHNHLGMVVGVLKAMARSQGTNTGKTLFTEAREKAERRMRERIEEARQNKAKGARAKKDGV
jgi:ubiquitin carboxyl-terminal hydrolase L5